MELTTIFVPVLSLGAVAVGLGALILFISKKFYVAEDPLVGIVNELLPGVNCGACGFPGCKPLAEELVRSRNATLTCPVGGPDVAQQLGQVLGIKMEEVKPVICTVLCGGTNSHAKLTAEYHGIADCWAATQLYVGPKQCSFACVGLGSCIPACHYDALRIEDGMIIVNEERCTGCGACIKECPKNVLVMAEKKKDRYYVACRSTEKGGVTKNLCDVGCLGCKKCERVCDANAITVENFVASINQELCTHCGKCVDVCSTHSIIVAHDLPVIQDS